MPAISRDAARQFQGGGALRACCPPPKPSADCQALASASDKATLAKHVYGKDKTLPPGYTYIDPDTPAGREELEQLQLEPEDLAPAKSDFRARVYRKTGADGRPDYVMSFRGTQSMTDWKTNAQQGSGLQSDHYTRAKNVAKQINRGSGGRVSFTGHSLGGGLASAAAVVTGKPATTFNAAGLHANTVEGYPSAPSKVDAYYVPGEVLSMVQDNRQAALAVVTGLTTAANQSVGMRAAGFVLANEVKGTPLLPKAYGNRHPLPVSAPQDKSWFDKINPVDKHGMDWVANGIAEKRKQLNCP